MKCPKCSYLGFEAGSRCRNCGYDFSLLRPAANVENDALDLPLHARREDAPRVEAWNDRIERAETAFPLFATHDNDGDTQAVDGGSPRTPLVVRHTPTTPRPRKGPRAPRVVREPTFLFGEDDGAASLSQSTAASSTVQQAAAPQLAAVSTPGARLAALLIDHAILLAIDFCVVYLTLRMATLPTTEWRLLPAAPLLSFLVLIKFAYFCAFTAVGGQTIGKMAVGIRVVTESDGWVDGACAVRRTAMGAVSVLVVGLGFLPAILSPDRRALHDRLSGTRVVSLRSA